jgi:hypothetical protein
VTLELERGTGADSAPPAGALVCAHGRRRAFRGWLELAAAIEDWRQTYAHDDYRREDDDT